MLRAPALRHRPAAAVHLELEKDLAAFMGTEAGIIYSYDIATASRQCVLPPARPQHSPQPPTAGPCPRQTPPQPQPPQPPLTRLRGRKSGPSEGAA